MISPLPTVPLSRRVFYRLAAFWLTLLIALPALANPGNPTGSTSGASSASASSSASDSTASKTISPDELASLVAPIALYPDALVAQILMASTYPLEIVEAARWVKANPDLKSDALESAMQNQSWDPSVKSLTAFPQVLAMMNDGVHTGSSVDTFGEFLETWVRDHISTRVRPTTLDGYRWRAKSIIKALGHHRLRDLEPHHIQAYHRSKLDEGLSPATILKHHILMRSALATAVNSIQCRGNTPLAKSLLAGGQHMQDSGGDVTKVIVLLSDGRETCGGDPVGGIGETGAGEL